MHGMPRAGDAVTHHAMNFLKDNRMRPCTSVHGAVVTMVCFEIAPQKPTIWPVLLVEGSCGVVLGRSTPVRRA